MNELNGNEKYYYFEVHLVSNKTHIDSIHKGVLCFIQDNCLVLFSLFFKTNYSYARIGRIKDVEHLSEVVGSRDISVEIKSFIK